MSTAMWRMLRIKTAGSGLRTVGAGLARSPRRSSTGSTRFGGRWACDRGAASHRTPGRRPSRLRGRHRPRQVRTRRVAWVQTSRGRRQVPRVRAGGVARRLPTRARGAGGRRRRSANRPSHAPARRRSIRDANRPSRRRRTRLVVNAASPASVGTAGSPAGTRTGRSAPVAASPPRQRRSTTRTRRRTQPWSCGTLSGSATRVRPAPPPCPPSTNSATRSSPATASTRRRSANCARSCAMPVRRSATGHRARCSRSNSMSGAPRCRPAPGTTCSARFGRCWSTQSRWAAWRVTRPPGFATPPPPTSTANSARSHRWSRWRRSLRR